MPEVIDLLSSSPLRTSSMSKVAGTKIVNASITVPQYKTIESENVKSADFSFELSSPPILRPINNGKSDSHVRIVSKESIPTTGQISGEQKRKSSAGIDRRIVHNWTDNPVFDLDDFDISRKKARLTTSTTNVIVPSNVTSPLGESVTKVSHKFVDPDPFNLDTPFVLSSLGVPKSRSVIPTKPLFVSPERSLVSQPKLSVWAPPAVICQDPKAPESKLWDRAKYDEDLLIDSSPTGHLRQLGSTVTGRGAKRDQASLIDEIVSSSQPESPMVHRTKKGPRLLDELIELISESEDDLPDLNKVVAKRSMPGDSFGDITSKRIGSKLSRTATAPIGGSKRTTYLTKNASAGIYVLKPAAENVSEKMRDIDQRKRDKERTLALAEANKVHEKKDTSREMILYLPRDLEEQILKTTKSTCASMKIETRVYDSPVPKVIKFQRRIRNCYNEIHGIWKPVIERIENENAILWIMTAEELVSLATCDGAIAARVADIRKHYPTAKVQLLLSGLAVFLRKNKNRREDQFRAAMPNASVALRRKAAANPSVDPEIIEDALLELQVVHKAASHQTGEEFDVTRWILVFTQYISIARYRIKREGRMNAGFCMETGQIKTGDDPGDTFVKMLAEVGRVTANVGWGLWKKYGGVKGLVEAFRRDGAGAVEGVQKVRNREGDAGEGVVGSALSKRLYKVFLGMDETSVDI